MNFNLMKPSDWYLLPNLHVSLSFCSVSFSGPRTRTGTLSTSPVSTNFASTRVWIAPFKFPICLPFSSHPFLEKESRIEIYRYSFLFPLPWIERKLVYAYFVIYFKFLQLFQSLLESLFVGGSAVASRAIYCYDARFFVLFVLVDVLIVETGSTNDAPNLEKFGGA